MKTGKLKQELLKKPDIKNFERVYLKLKPPAPPTTHIEYDEDKNNQEPLTQQANVEDKEEKENIKKPPHRVRIQNIANEITINREEFLDRFRRKTKLNEPDEPDEPEEKEQVMTFQDVNDEGVEEQKGFEPDDFIENPQIELEKQPIKIKRISRVEKMNIQPEQEEQQEQQEQQEQEKQQETKIKLQKQETIPNDRITEVKEKYKTRLRDEENEIQQQITKMTSYYQNNRKGFIDFVNRLFLRYKDELDDEEKKISCNDLRNVGNEFSLLTHQKIVRDYLNLYTPYRGLLIYHGLGSGKTCTSIAIAEGMKTQKKIIVMLPASLKQNYMKELKKCGDYLFKKNQYWEWIPIDPKNTRALETITILLSLPKEYVKRRKGVFLVNVNKQSNYESLGREQKKMLDEQIDEMINAKYTFIHYNGISNANLRAMTKNYTENIFSNKVVIIDEAHNFVSRIVNKIKSEKQGQQDARGNYDRMNTSLSLKLYELLLRAKKCKIIMLSGTPMINYPNEVGILFNILRGYIKTWEIPIITDELINENTIRAIFQKTRTVDYVSYNAPKKKLTITRNPLGFGNVFNKGRYTGVEAITHLPEMSDDDFQRNVIKLLKSNNIDVNLGQVRITNFKALPDKLEDFVQWFSVSQKVDLKHRQQPSMTKKLGRSKVRKNSPPQTEEQQQNTTTLELTNKNLFKRRIMGLTSYFRSAQEELLPRYDKSLNFQVVKIPMSDYQFDIYETARQEERTQETKKRKKRNAEDLYEQTNSTYRIFSRLYCNFVMPKPPGRPMPNQFGENAERKMENNKQIMDVEEPENEFKKLVIEEEKADDEIEGDDLLDGMGGTSYREALKETIEYLRVHSNELLSPRGLSVYSPKFLRMLENIQNPEHIGLNLIYSQFRTLEGLGVFMLVLEQNGFAQFKIKKNFTSGVWELDIKPEDMGKPKFALFTGTEDATEKDIIKSICNGEWNNGDVPEGILEEIRKIAPNNDVGQIIKVFMITASGAEGINLRNQRYVHIMEPYWHYVRIEQIIGRARRICSHKDLLEELQNIEVFIYLMTLSKEQLKSDKSIELRLKDRSRKDNTPQTTDETLYEIALLKEEFSKQIIKAIKEASIDCSIYNKANSKEGVQCFRFFNQNNNDFSYTPNISLDEPDEAMRRNIQEIAWVGKEIFINDKKYILKEETREVFDFDSYELGNPFRVGRLTRNKDGQVRFVRD